MKKFKSFPKAFGKIDKEKVRLLYLQGTSFYWTEFCAAYGFNPALRSNFPVRSWEIEWLQRKSVEQEQMLAPRVLELKGRLAEGRISVVDQQMRTNALLRDLLNKNIQRVGMNVSPAMCPIVSEELAILTKTNEILTKTEFQTLMVSAHTREQISEINAPPIEPVEDDSIPQIYVETLGAPVGMSSAELVEKISNYYDQYEKRDGSTRIDGGSNDCTSQATGSD